MSIVRVYQENDPDNVIAQINDRAVIAEELRKIGVNYERWQTQDLPDNISDSDILNAYSNEINRLKIDGGYKSEDIIRLTPDNDQKCDLRNKFLCEHTHSEDEVRFFVEGSGMFYIHAAGKVYMMLCTSGDLLNVPKNAPHWFDMGENPSFTCIRLFTSPNGWAANYTGDNIADNFPRFEQKAA